MLSSTNKRKEKGKRGAQRQGLRCEVLAKLFFTNKRNESREREDRILAPIERPTETVPRAASTGRVTTRSNCVRTTIEMTMMMTKAMMMSMISPPIDA